MPVRIAGTREEDSGQEYLLCFILHICYDYLGTMAQALTPALEKWKPGSGSRTFSGTQIVSSGLSWATQDLVSNNKTK